jgi:hypothetical protein
MADHVNASFKILHIQPNSGTIGQTSTVVGCLMQSPNDLSVFQGLPVILQKLLVNTFPGSGKGNPV